MDYTSGSDIDNNGSDISEFRVFRLIHESRDGFCRVPVCSWHGRRVVAKIE